MTFVKGQSGNPAGRPRGCRNKANRRAEFDVAELAPAFMEDLVARARDGNATAMKLVAERVMPASRHRPIEVSLPPLAAAADRAPAVAEIAHALGQGDITIAEAEGLLAFVRQALALAPAPAPDEVPPKIATQLADLQAMVGWLAGSRHPQAPGGGQCPNDQANHDVAPAGNERASSEIKAESTSYQAEINAESTTRSRPHGAESSEIKDRSDNENTGHGYDPMAAVVIASAAESE